MTIIALIGGKAIAVCGTPTTGVPSDYADSIWWFDFDGINVGNTAPQNKAFTLPNGESITVTIEGVSGSGVQGIAATNWVLNNFANVPSSNFASVKPTLQLRGRGVDTTIRVTFNQPINVIAADGEASTIFNGIEGLSATTNGGVWEVLDGYNTSGYVLTGGETTQFSTAANTSDSALWGTPLLVSRSATQLDIFLDTVPNGKTGIALGIIQDDAGDAPASYGIATHGIDIYNPSCTDYGSLLTYLGTTPPDGEYPANAQSSDAMGDDNTGVRGDDEDGINSFATLTTTDSSYSTTLTVNNDSASAASVFAWIDFDNSGTFDEDERATVTSGTASVTAGQVDAGESGTVNLTWSSLPSITPSNTYVRTRISTDTSLVAGSNGGVDEAATGFASDGEVEDYPITIMPRVIAGLCSVPLQFVPVADEDVANGLLGWPTTSSRTFTNVAGYGIDMVIETFAPNGVTPRDLGFLSSLNAIAYAAGTATGINWRGEISFFETGTTIPVELNDFNFILEDFETSGGTSAEKVYELFTETALGVSSQINFQTGTTITTFSGTPTYENGGLTLNGHYPISLGPDLGKWTRVSLPSGNYHKLSFAFGRDGAGNPAFGLCGQAGTDRGDAPTNYTSAPHSIGSLNVHFLGTIAPDSETLATFNAYPAGATGDGADEDGVIIPTLIAGSTSIINATVAGAGGYLQGWIDWNNDGDFLDTGEQIATDVEDGGASDLDGVSNGVIELSVPVPGSITGGQTYARFRWSTTNNLNATDFAANGEVEDYQVTILDLTPFPNCGQAFLSQGSNTALFSINEDRFPATFDAIGPASGIVYNALAFNAQNNLLYAIGRANRSLLIIEADGTVNDLGAITGLPGTNSGTMTPDGSYYVVHPATGNVYEIDINTKIATLLGSTGANLPDVAYNPVNDKLYGIRNSTSTLSEITVTGTFSNVNKAVSGLPSGGYGAVWMDGLGVLYLSNNTSGNIYRIEDPANAAPSATLVSGGQANSINDAASCPALFDLGDVPDSLYTNRTDNDGNLNGGTDQPGGRHVITNDLYMGSNPPDAEFDAVPSPTADTDDITDTDDEDGVSTFPTLTTANTSYSLDVEVTNTTGDSATLYGWIDFDNDGLFQADEVATASGATGTATLTWSNIGGSGPDISVGNSYLRLRLTTTSLSDDGGTASFDERAQVTAYDGEIEGYPLEISSLDYGDAPDTSTGTGVGDYQTLEVNGGPSHIIDPNIYLGAVAPDGDIDGFGDGVDANGDATDDDTIDDPTGGVDDEDAFNSFPSLSTTSTSYNLNSIPVENTTGKPAYLVGWIDFNGNGDFTDSGEQSNVATIPNNGTSANLSWLNLSGLVAGDTYARFRISTDSSLNISPSPTGLLSSEEVEDYQITISTEESLGVAKTIGNVTDNLDGSYNVAFTITLENLGNTVLTNLQVNDDLKQTFPNPASYIVTTPPTEISGPLDVNTNFDGDTDINLLAIGGADNILGVGETKSIGFVARVTPDDPTKTYFNQVCGEANGDSSGAGDPNSNCSSGDAGAVTDPSHNGEDPDPDDNKVADEDGNNDPTPIQFTNQAKLGVAKLARKLTAQGDGTYNVTYKVTVENMGNVSIANLQINDDLTTVFGGLPDCTGVTDTYCVVIGSIYSDDFTVNSAFSGDPAGTSPSDDELLFGANTLGIGESGSVKFTVNFDPDGVNRICNNVEGFVDKNGDDELNTGEVSDISTDGNDPDPDGNGNPTEQIPTCITISQEEEIGVAKVARSVSNNLGTKTDPIYQVSYEVIVENSGDVPLSNVQVIDDLTTVFTATEIQSFSISTGPTVSSANASMVVNTNYDGDSDINLLDGVGTLNPGENATISFVVEVTYNTIDPDTVPQSAFGAFNNQAIGSGSAPSGAVVTDESHDGGIADPEGDGPGDNSDPTPISFGAPSDFIINKSVKVCGATFVDVATCDGVGSYVTEESADPGEYLIYKIEAQNNSSSMAIGEVKLLDEILLPSVYVEASFSTTGTIDGGLELRCSTNASISGFGDSSLAAGTCTSSTSSVRHIMLIDTGDDPINDPDLDPEPNGVRLDVGETLTLLFVVQVP